MEQSAACRGVRGNSDVSQPGDAGKPGVNGAWLNDNSCRCRAGAVCTVKANVLSFLLEEASGHHHGHPAHDAKADWRSLSLLNEVYGNALCFILGPETCFCTQHTECF